jgi:phage protein D
MGIDTRAYYPNVTKKQIIDFLKIVGKDVRKENTYSDMKGMEGYSSIDFKFKDEQRSMHMHDVIIDVGKDEARYLKKYKKQRESESWIYVKQDGLPDHTKGTTLSVGYWGSGVILFTIMAYLWGGYIDEQDTEGKKHYRIKKDHRALIRYLFGGNSK